MNGKKACFMKLPNAGECPMLCIPVLLTSFLSQIYSILFEPVQTNPTYGVIGAYLFVQM